MKTLRIFIPALFAAIVALSLVIMPTSIEAAAEAARPNPVPVVQPAVAPLNADEIADLTYMREEEKLARDVYITLYDVWGVQVFQNISRSEQSHMDAILTLLDRYGIVDPTVGNAVGEFTNPDLQALYDQLVATGSQSLADALKVGGAIEEIDIIDLEKAVDETDKADIQRVYASLLNGSYNHLRAFVSTLANQTGEVYEPQYMTADAYSTIVNSAASNGSSRGGRRGR